MRQKFSFAFRLRRLVPLLAVLAVAGCSSTGAPAPVVNRSLEASHAKAPVFDRANRQAAGRTVAASKPAAPAQPPLVGAQAPAPVAAQSPTTTAGGIESMPVRSGRIESSPIAGDRGAGDAPIITMTPAGTNEPPQVAAAPAPAAGAVGMPPAADTSQAPPVAPVASRSPSTEAAPAAARSSRPFTWPAQGAVTKSFTDPKSMGIAIAGKLGDPVTAAADGEVIFSGLGPRGYGKLLIVRHDADLLSVYANNRVLLAKEGQAVRQGDKIAELGDSGTDQPRLHFEVRRQGKPVDPIGYLPPAAQ